MIAKFVIWDVQHGNACHVETPVGKRLVIAPERFAYVLDKRLRPKIA